MGDTECHVLRVPTCRAQIEVQARRPLTPAEEERFRAAILDVGLAGEPFDEASFIYPFQIPADPYVVVLGEAPRRVSVRVRYKQGLCVGVVAGEELEAAYLAHPGTFLYVVGAIQERQKGERSFLDVRPRGWLIVEVGPDTESAASPTKTRQSRARKKAQNQ